MVEQDVGFGFPPSGAPLYPLHVQRDEHFDSSVKAVSFGFVATAILIFMFLLMAIFERLLRPTSPPAARTDLESQFKLAYPSPKMSLYGIGVSVLMPGEDIPTFIAHPAPVDKPPEGMP